MIHIKQSFIGLRKLNELSKTQLENGSKKTTKDCNLLPPFYVMPKIHKPTLCPRGIVAASKAPTMALSCWLSHVLIPGAQRMPYYIRDSSHLISILQNKTFPSNAYIVVGDVKEMYPNMNFTNSMRGIDIAIEHVYQNKDKPEWTKYLKLAVSILYQYNYFVYNKVIYHQGKGLPMGSNASAPISDLYLCPIELDMLSKVSSSMFYGRFRDDIILIGTEI